MPIKDAYSNNHVDFEISSLTWEEDATTTFGSIEFEYSAPAISVDSSGRFVKHEIIGGMTVRQKIGENPINVDISGVCKESIAKKLDGLRNAKYGKIFSNRLPGESLTVQFASVSTSPLEDGGAVALTDSSSEFLYQYTISAVEIEI